MTELIFRAATSADVPALRDLVESAYRGERARAGWTHEADLLSGQRTDHAMLADILANPAQTLTVAEEAGQLCGCVCITDKGDRAYLGMLTVAPGLQGKGLGRRLATEGERIARALGHDLIEMTVITQRPELIAWYERLGYVNTGRIEPFPANDPRFGIPLRDDLAFVVLEKARIGTEQAPNKRK